MIDKETGGGKEASKHCAGEYRRAEFQGEKRAEC